MAYLADEVNPETKREETSVSGAEGQSDGARRDAPRTRARRKKLAPAGVIFSLAGLALFAYVVWQAGVWQIWSELESLGYGFLIILALSGFRFAVRTLAWTLCFESPYRLGFRDAFKAYLAGDAIGNVIPLGIVVSEPTKVYFVRERVPLVAGLSAIAVENIFYSLSVILFIFSGAVALMLSFPLPSALRWTSVSVIGGVTLTLAVGFIVVRGELRILSRLAEKMYARGLGRKVLETRRATLRSLEDRVYGFYRRNRARFLPILLLEISFHLAGVAEAYVTLFFITGSAPSLLSAFVLESVNRVINVVFKFVPLRVGVDEAGTGLMTKVLGFGRSIGVTLGIVRKARMLIWTAIGIGILVRRGLSVRRVVREAEESMAEGKLAMTKKEEATAEG